jgi:hypothetical protein
MDLIITIALVVVAVLMVAGSAARRSSPGTARGTSKRRTAGTHSASSSLPGVTSIGGTSGHHCGGQDSGFGHGGAHHSGFDGGGLGGHHC